MQKLLKMKAYKGFNRSNDGTLSCQGFVYESGKTYKHEGEIELCRSGFHACHELWETWFFYPNNGKNIFYEVECGGDIIDNDNKDGKFVCSEIKLVKEIDITDVAKFNEAGGFSEGFARVEMDGKWNFINIMGKLLSELWFDKAWNFHEGFAVVYLNRKWNYINPEGKILSELWFDDAYDFCGGLAKVHDNGKWNFVDTKGKLLSERWFDYAYDFSEGFAVVQVNGKYNFIGTEGNLLSELWFDDASDYFEGFALVELNGKVGKISTKGELVDE